MSKSGVLAIACVLTSLSIAVRADTQAGEACAKALTSDGKQIYAAAMAAKPTMPSIQATMEAATRDLAAAGKITRGVTARDNSMAAGKCVAASLQ